MFYERDLKLPPLLAQKSHFLFGPRMTGKSSWLKKTLPKTHIVDLLQQDTYHRHFKNPSLLREKWMVAKKKPKIIVIDEIQRLPILLNEVHWMIENCGCKFLLTGSSARKLRRAGVNLLGGRAWWREFFPLTSYELKKNFQLIKYLNTGGLPHIYTSPSPRLELKNYIQLYLTQEVQNEALAQKLEQFVKWTEHLGSINASEINCANWSNTTGVPAKTIAFYIQLLYDTLLAFELPAYKHTKLRKPIRRSKFYLFDVGVAGHMMHRGKIKAHSPSFGLAFEHFIIQELRAYLSYRGVEAPLSYWRSTSQMEVDVCLGHNTAIEIKSSHNITSNQLKNLKALREEKIFQHYIVVSQDPESRLVDGILILPVHKFLSRLWRGKIV